jgi:hydroxymethylpyrimidine pyrophosphatase-like HAD family hydrolase
MDIVIDFDGTVVSHEFPEVGKDIGAETVLKKLVESGHNLILFTMRSNNGNLPLITEKGIISVNGDYLDHAVKWFEEKGIKLHGVQKNPTQHTWTTSPKAYGQIIIDDAALGCPLRLDTEVSSRPFVDWKRVENILTDSGVLK